ncbi:MAG: hypothetical protein JWN36_1877, partial [Microbacteriaceae bacterium]|nr:hypothetical protein [Microbacteriaceae bacterium]
ALPNLTVSIAEVPTVSSAGALIGVGELDGDPEPEIVLDYNGVVDGALVSGLIVYDEHLAELWRVPMSDVGWHPFTLADLDGDGLHEIVVRDHDALTIYGPDGTLLATIPTGNSNNHWKNVPLVVDLDGDGLAEIVVSGSAPAVQVFESAAGGWLVPDPDVPAPGVDFHPGILNVDGTVPAETDWWTAANVWQGHAAIAGGPALPNLTVSIAEVCGEGCVDDLYVTVYVANAGAADIAEPVPVSVTRIADGVEVASGRLAPPLAAGTERALELRVPVASAVGGLRATVDRDAAILECDETDDAAVWSDVVCP